MSWLYTFFCKSKPVINKSSAGCFFTDTRHVLAGYQANKKIPTICGIGGKVEEGETHIYAAIRETLEELFHIEPSPTLILSIIDSLPPEDTIINGSYHIFVYSFKDLQKLFTLLESYKVTSPLFYSLPNNILELVSNRKIESSCEISHLALIPLVDTPIISKFLFSDIRLISLARSKSEKVV